MNNKKVSAAIFCQWPSVDTDPENSWILQNCIEKENYLQRVIKRLKSWDLFNNIYLLVGEEKRYSVYFSYGDEQTKVIQMSENDFKDSPRSKESIWNTALYKGRSHFIPVWLYQIQLAFKEEILLCDLACRFFLKKEMVEKAIEIVLRKPESPVGFTEELSTSALVLHKKSLEPLFNEKLIGHKRNPLQLYGEKTFFLAESGTIFPGTALAQLQMTKGYYYNLMFHGKRGFLFLKNFYTENLLPNENSFAEKFADYFTKNKSWFDQQPDVIRINLIDGSEKELSIFYLGSILTQAEAIGQLTIIINNLHKHSQLSDILSLLQTKKLHYYLETNGQYPTDDNPLLAKTFDIIKFINIDDIDVENLQKKHPNTNAELTFQNLFTLMKISHENFKPQIGIECNLGDSDIRNAEIIDHWRVRTSSIEGFSGKNPAMKFFPQIQFVCYKKKELQKYEPKTKPEIIINPNDEWLKKIDTSEKSLENHYLGLL